MTSVTSKIFVGTKMTAELRPLASELTVIHHEGREYLGRYAKSSSPSLEEVRIICHELASIFADHRAEVPSRSPKIVVFPQFFLG